jgi:lipopolysaccharide/colanic/teichoic acid biosynthesis glycosyltransferase
MLFVKNIIKVIAGFMEYLSFNVTFIFLVAIFIPVCAGAKGPDVVRETKYAKDPVNIEMTIKPLSGKEAAIIYFGDGTEASENINITKTGAIILQHVYKNPGDYTVVVRVHRAVGNVKQDQWYRKCLKVSNQNSLPEPSTTVLFSLAIAGLILQVSKKFYIRLRRLLDIIISIIALAVASPIMIVVAIIIKIDSPGPILYKQIRVGLNRRQGKSVSLESLDRRDSNCLGKLFYIYKFRTMRVDAESETGAVWAAPGDNRITRLGRFLRKSRLDELPQFYNVIRGEMSFIGPRPERPEFVKDLNNYICLYNKRLDIKPGITGLAQVRFSYSSSVKDTKKKVKYDLLYLKNNCFLMDLRILLSTFLTVILAKGAR